jgi:hypothetical protein
MELEGAQKCKVYLEAGAIKAPAIYTAFQTATASMAPADIWTAQLWLWIDEDVATGVANANASAKNVLDAPVKQITVVEVKDPPYLISGDPTAGSDSAALTAVQDVTPTGRVCNGMYDVVQFHVGLDVDATRVIDVLNGLQKGQFITVLWWQMQTVDSAGMAAQKFIYGKAPIIHLDLVCEELLLHQWLSKIQPPDGGPGKYFNAQGNGSSSGSGFFAIVTHAAGN